MKKKSSASCNYCTITLAYTQWAKIEKKMQFMETEVKSNSFDFSLCIILYCCYRAKTSLVTKLHALQIMLLDLLN